MYCVIHVKYIKFKDHCHVKIINYILKYNIHLNNSSANGNNEINKYQGLKNNTSCTYLLEMGNLIIDFKYKL